MAASTDPLRTKVTTAPCATNVDDAPHPSVACSRHATESLLRLSASSAVTERAGFDPGYLALSFHPMRLPGAHSSACQRAVKNAMVSLCQNGSRGVPFSAGPPGAGCTAATIRQRIATFVPPKQAPDAVGAVRPGPGALEPRRPSPFWQRGTSELLCEHA